MQLKRALLAVDEAVALQPPRRVPRRRTPRPSSITHGMEEVCLAIRGMLHIIRQAEAHRRGFCTTSLTTHLRHVNLARKQSERSAHNP
jgi:hypothetical protein